jgi:thymidylate synthase
MTNVRNKFNNADEAFNYFYPLIRKEGIEFGDTKALFNIGFWLDNPLEMDIKHPDRKWNKEYAQAEWEWYLTEDPHVSQLGEIYGKVPPIWEKMQDSEGKCRSNYGWQWSRNYQLDHVVAMLKDVKDTRQAAISIYDGKEISTYRKDTPCTYAVQFTIVNDKLNMAVVMRSNDLWYGFCNDQYCFAMLQNKVAERVSKDVGSYYHFAHNLHLYNNKIKQ